MNDDTPILTKLIGNTTLWRISFGDATTYSIACPFCDSKEPIAAFERHLVIHDGAR